MSSATLPPPLSDSPTVETLERLLAGLHQPVQRGVPSPPDAERSLDEGMFESATPAADTVATDTAPVAPSPVAPAPAAPPSRPAAPPPAPGAPSAPPASDRTGSTPLSWSAAHARRGRWTPTATALGVAVVTAAGIVAGLVAAGEIPLP